MNDKTEDRRHALKAMVYTEVGMYFSPNDCVSYCSAFISLCLSRFQSLTYRYHTHPWPKKTEGAVARRRGDTRAGGSS